MNTTTQLEKKINEYTALCIYAAMDDIADQWNNDMPYNAYLHQSYENLCKDKADRGSGLSSRFTLNDSIRQFLVFHHAQIITELNKLCTAGGLGKVSTLAQLLDIVVAEENDESYIMFAGRLVQNRAKYVGGILRACNDPTNYAGAQLAGRLPGLAANKVLLAVVSTMFDDFVKSIAQLMAVSIWYTKCAASQELFCSLMAQHGMTQCMIDEMRGSIRAKPPPKPRVKKAPAASTETAPAESVTTETPTSDILVI